MAENGENLQKDQEGNWARPVSRLKVKDIPQGATGINLDGRPVYGALQGLARCGRKLTGCASAGRMSRLKR